MEFRLLGPVEVRVPGEPLPLGGPKQRALLALLLLNANRPVSRDLMVEALWGEAPPTNARQSLDSYLSRLRRLIGHERLLREPGGYRVGVEESELDLDLFETVLNE